MVDQILDQMDLERERGINDQLQAVRLEYAAKNGQTYILNLIDTPWPCGLPPTRCLGAWRLVKAQLLVIDASQGIEAQTLANLVHGLRQ